MKQKAPAFQFYPKQWLGDDKVMLMDWDARGMHFHLVCISWQQAIPGTIPHDEIIIRRWLKDPVPTVWKRVWPQIRTAWKIWGKNNDFLYSRGMLREYRKIQAFSRKQKKNAKQRWLIGSKNQPDANNATAYATAMPRHQSGNARAGNALQSSSSSAEVKEGEGKGSPPTFSVWLAKVNDMPEAQRFAQRDVLVAELTLLHLPFAYQDEIIEKYFLREKNHGADERPSIFSLPDQKGGPPGHSAAGPGLRKPNSAREVFAGVRNTGVPRENRPEASDKHD